MTQKKKGYGLFLIITIIASLGAIATLIPQAGASKPCMLGYSALCTYTPVSTIVLLLIAGFSCVYRGKKLVVKE